jgi:DNA-binding CsgD family transcriptional regulator
MNLALPLVFLILGGAFFIQVYALEGKWRLSSILYIPGCLLLVFGLVFLINVLTGDWNAWAYAWLLLLAGIGAGIVLANQCQIWPLFISLIGWGLTIGGITFFAVFGAIAGGFFIQIMAPIIIILAGLSLRWLHIENILPESILRRFNITPRAMNISKSNAQANSLVEALSRRELEVLALIDQGLTNQQIALKLHIAPSTVKTHINNTYGKLGVQTRLQAVRRAREMNLIDD